MHLTIALCDFLMDSIAHVLYRTEGQYVSCELSQSHTVNYDGLLTALASVVRPLLWLQWR